VGEPTHARHLDTPGVVRVDTTEPEVCEGYTTLVADPPDDFLRSSLEQIIWPRVIFDRRERLKMRKGNRLGLAARAAVMVDYGVGLRTSDSRAMTCDLK
jgi:hypothetical protein